ncbi:MAG TPA: hypothetical protein VJV22_14850, partial [Acidobacteriaceae bacterium]|nr:hypothetical protein [Acidobacteriaceae bacterium]
VTRAASPSDFDVNTIRILCDEKTSSGWSNSDTSFSGCPKKTPQLGESITVWGKLHKDQNTLNASRIVESVLKIGGGVGGAAVIDAPPIHNAPGFPAGTIMVRADGYWIVIPFSANITLWGSIKSVEEVNTNTWIEYQGNMRPDGIVVASEVRLMSNVLTPKEEKRHNKPGYDPASASQQPKQSSLSADFRGIDLKRIPPRPDAPTQARVSSIGEKLIPEYQKALPDSDLSKIHFRFDVVDANWGAFPVLLPNGTILIPHEAVDLMRNDSQLAALLSDSIAALLEKQDFRISETLNELRAGKTLLYTAEAIDLQSPAYWALWAGARTLGVDEGTRMHRQMAQSARVSLMLMRDAGYDITQAPLAWWILSSGKKPISETRPPAPTVDLYLTLAALWSHPEPPIATP